MIQLRPRSFGSKLILMVTITSGVMAALVCVMLLAMNYVRMRALAIEKVEGLARTTAVHSASTVDFDDPGAANETLAALGTVPEVGIATILDVDDKPFAIYRSSNPERGAPPSEFATSLSANEFVDGWLMHAEPILQEGRRVGTLHLGYDMSTMTLRLRQNAVVSLAASLIVMVFAMVIAARLQRLVMRPVGELVATARRISEERDFSIRARKVSQDELGTFTDEFNGMLEQLQNHEELLHAAHQRFRTAVEAAPNAMIMVDEGGSIVLVNRQTERMFGYERKDLIGNSIELLVPEDFRPIHPQLRAGYFQAPSARPMGAQRDLFARKKDGTQIPVEIGLSPIRTDEGIRVLSSIVDITDRRRAEQERANILVREQEARAEAERANRMKDEFLATLSHELRTPMTAILGWARMLRGGDGDGSRSSAAEGPDLERGLEIIERNARTQAQIIEDLLDMSRIISGKVRLDVQQVDLKDVIEAAVSTVRPAADARGIRLQSVLDSTVGPIKGDSNRLQQVVWNLISNAIKFTPRGGRVQIALERINSHVEISVSDTGQGIAPAFLPHVFERFRQADASSTRQHGGLGIGLAIVKQLIELHGGSVHAQSPGEGKGSTFIIKLPIAIVHAPRTEEELHPRVSRPSPMPGEPLSLRGVKVLVVDDEPDARDLIGKLLEDAGAEVVRSGSASEALDAFGPYAPDVLVSDIGMPDIDGYDLIRQVRARPASEGGSTPAIALTAFARSEDRTRSLLAGYQLHIAKPVEPNELMVSVATLAGMAQRESGISGDEPKVQ